MAIKTLSSLHKSNLLNELFSNYLIKDILRVTNFEVLLVVISKICLQLYENTFNTMEETLLLILKLLFYKTLSIE